MNHYAIVLKNVTKHYGDFTLGPVNLSLPCGTVMGLVGENGAGKSTTIRLILDLIRQDAGEITVCGQNTKDGMRLTKEDIGVVLDDIGIPESLTPREVASIMRHTFKNWDDAQYRDCLRRFSLPENKKLKAFSRGMKMKTAIAVALSHNAKLLILDEATSGLDPVVRDEILDLFADFTRCEEHAILMSSHIVSDLEKICDYIAFLHKGKLLLCEEKDVLRDSYGILRTTEDALSAIAPDAVIGKKTTPWGTEALVRRDAVPSGWELGLCDIEQLFIFMTKGVS